MHMSHNAEVSVTVLCSRSLLNGLLIHKCSSNPNKHQAICVNPTQMHPQCVLTLDLLHWSRWRGFRAGLCLHMFSSYRFPPSCVLEPLRLKISQTYSLMWKTDGSQPGKKTIFFLFLNSFLIHGNPAHPVEQGTSSVASTACSNVHGSLPSQFDRFVDLGKCLRDRVDVLGTLGVWGRRLSAKGAWSALLSLSRTCFWCMVKSILSY